MRESNKEIQRLIYKVFGEQADNAYCFRDVRSHKLYSALTYEPGSLVSCNDMFFATPSNQVNITDTNMVCCMRLPAPEMFSIQKISFKFSTDTDVRSRVLFMENVSLQLTLGYKYYWRGLIMHMQTRSTTGEALIRKCTHCRSVYVTRNNCPQCGSPEFSMLLEAPEGAAHLEGAGEVEHFEELQVPIVIAQQMDFYVGIRVHNSIEMPGKLKVWCILGGLHAVGVQ